MQKRIITIIACLLIAVVAQAQTYTWYQDLDGDGWGNPNVSITAATQPTGYVLNNLDCNDGSVNSTQWRCEDSTRLYDSTWQYVPFERYDMAVNSNDEKCIVFRANDNWVYNYQVMRYNGNQFIKLPDPNNISTPTSIFHQARLAYGINDTIYICYSDPTVSNKLTVKKFNGTNWQTIGNNGFSPSSVLVFHDMIIYNGVPYVVFSEGNGITVMTFNGTSWSYLGSRGFITTTEGFDKIDIGADNNGTIYVYADGGISSSDKDKAYVWKYTGGNWNLVGTPIDRYYSSAFALSPSGVPHILYVDKTNKRMTLRKYDGTNWSLVGNAGFSDSTGGALIRLAFDPMGRAYALYPDASLTNYWLTMKRFDGTSWATLGDAAVSNAYIYENQVSMDVGKDGIPNVMLLYYHFPGGGKLLGVRRIMPVGGSGTTGPTQPTASGTPTTINAGDSSVLKVTAGSLNDATDWIWYTGSCGGTKATLSTNTANGVTVSVKPTTTTTYYVRGEGGCLPAGACDSVTITVNTTSISSLSGEPKNISIYPNPNSGVFTIKGIFVNSNEAIISVSNTIGQVLFSATVKLKNNQLDYHLAMPTNTPKGIYLLSLKMGENFYNQRISIK
ncbi:MAG: T9SS type A sorting domain-containing protein [Flavipsychrobacter sp.]